MKGRGAGTTHLLCGLCGAHLYTLHPEDMDEEPRRSLCAIRWQGCALIEQPIGSNDFHRGGYCMHVSIACRVH